MRSLTRRGVLASGIAFGLCGGVSVASAKPRDDGDTAFRAKVDDAVGDDELCVLPRRVASTLGVAPGEQVRIRYEGEPTVFTVDVHDGATGAFSAGGRDRLGARGNSVRVEGDPQVVDPTTSRATAAETGEFIGRRVDGDASVVAVAPHGGYIEYGTDLQATRVAERLGASAWYCAGWWPGGGAYRRWHVTSTAIHPNSFPALDGIRDRRFRRAVSFHGWGESFLAVGGTAPVELRTAIRDELAAVVDGAFDVRLATDPARDGTDPDNVVNWLTESGHDGIQIEQPWLARTEYREVIADRVADVLARQTA